MKKKFLVGMGAGVFIALIGVGIFGEHGILRLWKLKAERIEIEREKTGLQKENQGLAKKIDLLKNNLKYLEQLARKKLGMIRPDEVIIKLPEDDSRNSPPEAPGPQKPEENPN